MHGASEIAKLIKLNYNFSVLIYPKQIKWPMVFDRNFFHFCYPVIWLCKGGQLHYFINFRVAEDVKRAEQKTEQTIRASSCAHDIYTNIQRNSFIA